MHVIACGVCECTSGHFCCDKCVNGSSQERRQLLQVLKQKRNDLEQKLNACLVPKNSKREQDVELLKAKDALRYEKRRAAKAERELAEAREAAEKLKAQNETRRLEISGASSVLAAHRTQTLTRQFPTLLRYQSLTHAHVGAMLLREQKLKLKQLLDILPLRVTGISSGVGSAVQVSICDLKLPESVSVPLNGWQQPEAVSAAMGYLMLFLDLVSTYLGGPLLHEGSFQGSTTVLWSQTSFWNRRPACSNGVLPLYLEEIAPSSGPFPALSTKPVVSRWSAITLLRSTSSYIVTSTTNARSSGPSDNGSTASTSASAADASGPSTSSAPGGSGTMSRPLNSNGDLRLAFDMLLRSTSCLVRDKAATLNLQLPGTWGPVGWLVMLCSYLFKDSRTDGVMAAATKSVISENESSETGKVYLEDGMEREELQYTSHSSNATMDPMRMVGDPPGPDDFEPEGWDLLAPFLPPPPSEPEEVEHWTRAMFTDASSTGGASRLLPGTGGITAALQAGSRSLTRRSTSDTIRGLLGAGLSAVGTLSSGALSGRGT